MIIHLIDAHPLIWFLEGNSKLGASARDVLVDRRANLVVPAPALAEACWAVRKRRTLLDDWRDVIRATRRTRRIRVYPLSGTIVTRAMALPRTLEMHDAQIIATGLILADAGADVRLVTLDRPMVDSGLLPIVW